MFMVSVANAMRAMFAFDAVVFWVLGVVLQTQYIINMYIYIYYIYIHMPHLVDFETLVKSLTPTAIEKTYRAMAQCEGSYSLIVFLLLVGAKLRPPVQLSCHARMMFHAEAQFPDSLETRNS